MSWRQMLWTGRWLGLFGGAPTVTSENSSSVISLHGDVEREDVATLVTANDEFETVVDHFRRIMDLFGGWRSVPWSTKKAALFES